MSELTLQAARRIDPRKVALALAVFWLVFAIPGLAIAHGFGTWNLRTFSLQDSNLDGRLSTPAAFTAFLLLCAAGLAFALASVDRTMRAKKWRVAGWVLLVFGVEELLGVHSWLESKGSHWAIDYLPLLLLGTAGLLGVLGLFGRQPHAQVEFGGAICLWILGGAVDNGTLSMSSWAPELLEMASAILFVVALLERHRYLARQYYPMHEGETRLSVDQIAAEALGRVPVRSLAIVLPAIMAVLAIQYVLLHRGNYHHAERLAFLDLNNEETLADVYQASLLFAGGGLAILISRLRATCDEAKRWWLVLGLVLLPLGAEQMIAFHSRFQDMTGLPGQVILMPIAILGTIAWFKALSEVSRNRLVRVLWIAGAAAWVLSQASDVFLNPIDAFRWTITLEETAESLGSALWLFALLYWLKSVLPMGFAAAKPSAVQLNGLALIKPLEEPERAEAPTG